MAIQLDEKVQRLLKGKNFAFIGAIAEDGGPQVTPVWVDYDGQYVIFNTEQKRAKTRNLKSRPQVAVTIADAANPYHYAEIRGKVVDITPAGAAEHIDKMAMKYMGKEKYPFHQPGDVRVIVKIEPLKVHTMG